MFPLTMTRRWPLLAVCLLFVTALSLEVSANGLVNEDVKRTVDLSTHLAKITAEIVLSNHGQSSVQSFILAVDADLAPHMAYIGASAERQLVIFQGNHYLYSPYPTRSQTTRVRLASKTVESYTKLGNPSKTDEIIEYGPFRDLKTCKSSDSGHHPIPRCISVSGLFSLVCCWTMVTPHIFLLPRPSFLPQLKMCTTGMRLATSPPPICRFWMTLWRWRSDHVSPCLEAGRLTISSATICQAMNTSTPLDPAAEVRMKVASITEQVLTLVNKRLGLYRHMDEVVNRYKQSRDTGALNSGRKTLEADHRTLTNEISSLQARLKTEGSDLAEKVCESAVGEIQKLDGQVKDLVCRSCLEAERLVAGPSDVVVIDYIQGSPAVLFLLIFLAL
ncbi:hypothetical protein XENOCAPTIV_020083 [Xenoophorus captivus]|uniref:Dolichyl-diphosphooligosaccharide--protein glycosyltransferase subunit 1 n=1 Tax=Xenoophorus captivus TaxID=1517983 RepID=A0ABV0RB51_9TELE